MKNQPFLTLKTELFKGFQKKGHPFRYFTLATIDKNNRPVQRTVVLRAVDNDVKLTFFTDNRSPKVHHILKNNNVSALFYNPENQLQLQLRGIGILEKNVEILEKHWSTIQPNSKKDYTTKKAPGSERNDSEAIVYSKDINHFCMVHIKITEIEYLKLGSEEHLRMRFTHKNKKWNSQTLVP